MTTTSRDVNGTTQPVVVSAQANAFILLPGGTALWEIEMYAGSNSQAAQWSIGASTDNGATVHAGAADYSYNVGTLSNAGLWTTGGGDNNANASSILAFSAGNVTLANMRYTFKLMPAAGELDYFGHHEVGGNQNTINCLGGGRYRGGAFNAIQLIISAGTLSFTYMTRKLA